MDRVDHEMNALADAVNALRCHENAAWKLHDLAQVNDVIASLGGVRDDIVQHLRVSGHTWESMSTVTGVPISTWRRRHTRLLSAQSDA